MIKILSSLLVVLSVYSLSAKAELGGDDKGEPSSLRDVLNYCLDEPSNSSKQECAQYGFDYETYETTFAVSANEQMRFTSDVISLYGNLVGERFYEITVQCNDCEGVNAQQEMKLLGQRMLAGFASAAQNASFSSKRISKNGRPTNEQARKNNGSNWAESLKNFSETTTNFSDIASEWFSDEVKLMIVTDVDTNPYAIVRTYADKVTVVADLTRLTPGNNLFGKTLGFSGNVHVDVAGVFNDLIANTLPGSGDFGKTCTTTYTGKNDSLIAQVTCY